MAAQKFRDKASSRRPNVLVVAVAGLSCAGLLLPYWAAGRDKRAVSNSQKGDPAEAASLKGLPPRGLSEDQAIVHALNRLGYGPRPGDVQRIKTMGLAKWIDRQLHPESLNDSALEARLSRFPTLSMSSEDLLQKFPRPAVAAKREGISPEEYRKEQQAKLQARRQPAETQQSGDNPQEMSSEPKAEESQQNESAQPSGNSQQGGNNASPQAMAPDELAEILLPGAKNVKNQNSPGNPANNPLLHFQEMQAPQRIIAELAMAKMDRAVYSEKQLYEQMVDFWFNHFNVFAGKGADRWLLTSYERDAIRPHAMG
jgi:uncharacterized protein (DUF1800 family)